MQRFRNVFHSDQPYLKKKNRVCGFKEGWQNKGLCLCRWLELKTEVDTGDEQKECASTLEKAFEVPSTQSFNRATAGCQTSRKPKGHLEPIGSPPRRALGWPRRCSARGIWGCQLRIRSASAPCRSPPRRCWTLLPHTPMLLCRRICCSGRHIFPRVDTHHKLSRVGQAEYSSPSQ